MTYIIADTHKKGKNWARKYIPYSGKYCILSTIHQMRGLSIDQCDCVYIITANTDLLRGILPVLCYCHVVSCNEWIAGRYKKTRKMKNKIFQMRQAGARIKVG